MSEPQRKTLQAGGSPSVTGRKPKSPDAKLPEGDVVVFLVLDMMPSLDVRRFSTPDEDETRGAPPFDPAMMVCLLLYASCVGVF